MLKINFDSLLYIEGLKDYVVFVTQDKRYIVNNSLKNLEEKLPDSFLRIHHSYIVNFTKITALKDNHIIIDTVKIPLSKSYKSVAVQLIKKDLI